MFRPRADRYAVKLSNLAITPEYRRCSLSDGRQPYSSDSPCNQGKVATGTPVA
ncbi:hypothetical protein MicB006_1184 [Micromonospora sp. B006]|nr:hypothetical protein MicB006_1184 [Micromonospora sp. B006]